MKIYTSTVEKTNLITVSGDQTVVASIHNMLEAENSPLRDVATRLRESVASFALTASGIVERFTATARVPELQSAARKALSGPFLAFVAAGRAEARLIIAAKRRALIVPDANPSMSLLRHEHRKVFSGMSIGEQAAWIENAGFEQLASLIEAGQASFAQMSNDIWKRAEDRYAIHNHILTTGMAANFERQPSAQHPLATGVDHDAVEKAAAIALDELHGRHDLTDLAELAAHGIINVVAVTCEMHVPDAFNLLMGKDA